MFEAIQAFVILGLIFYGIPAGLIALGIFRLFRGGMLSRLLVGPLLILLGGLLGYLVFYFILYIAPTCCV